MKDPCIKCEDVTENCEADCFARRIFEETLRKKKEIAKKEKQAYREFYGYTGDVCKQKGYGHQW